jgi:transcriptional regulator with XRE-family HTH domain
VINLKNRIRELRKTNSITAIELANELNVSPRSLNAYESGQRKPSPEVLVKIADYFKCSLDYLMLRSEIKNIEDYNKVILNAIKEGLSHEQLNTMVKVWREAKREKDELSD